MDSNCFCDRFMVGTIHVRYNANNARIKKSKVLNHLDRYIIYDTIQKTIVANTQSHTIPISHRLLEPSNVFVVHVLYTRRMAKMNWERVRTENRSALADHQTRNYLNQRKSQNRAAMRRKYGWWTKYGDDWFVAVDSETSTPTHLTY